MVNRKSGLLCAAHGLMCGVVRRHIRIRHSVEVEAQSLYEAAVLAIRVFRQHDCEPREANRLEIEVRSAVVHTLSIKKINEWLNGGARTPKEAVTKERFRALL
jgi:hypothetical protein